MPPLLPTTVWHPREDRPRVSVAELECYPQNQSLLVHPWPPPSGSRLSLTHLSTRIMDDFPHLQCHLPTELLRQIVIDYASSERQAGDQASQPRHSYKPPWSTIQPLTLASKVLRELALEAWFEIYYAHSPDDLLHVWPMFSSWTRCGVPSIPSSPHPYPFLDGQGTPLRRAWN